MNTRALRIKKFEVRLILYILLAILFFALFAYRDIYNTTEQGSQYDTIHMYADHPTYVNYFRFFRENLLLFLVVRINYLGPFFIIWLTGDNLIMVFIFNLICLILSIKIVERIRYFDMNKYSILMLANPITFISIFSVNKEMISLVGVSFFVSSLIEFRVWKLVAALFFAFLSRKELSLFLIFLYLVFYFIPRWEKYQVFLSVMLLLLISIGSYYINRNFSSISGYNIEVEDAVENAGSSGTILLLNSIQNRYGYYLVFIPKTFLNIYGSVLTRTLQMIFFKDVYNDVVVWGQSFLFLYVLPRGAYLYWKSTGILYKQLFFSFVVSCIMFSYIPVVQNRYFYSSYILLILIISIRRENIQILRE